MLKRITLLVFIGLLLAGCQNVPEQPLPTVDNVELSRFMGDWYVIAAIPTFLERNAYNAVESYRLLDNGTVETTFSFRDGGFNGKLKRYHPTGYIKDLKSNAVWGVEFIWPFKADYRVMYLAADYSVTIIGRLRRDYVWIMARSPSIPDSEYDRLVGLVVAAGYNTSKLRKVPQRQQKASP
jgi:apolipoprotein D and lipocalin family protein